MRIYDVTAWLKGQDVGHFQHPAKDLALELLGELERIQDSVSRITHTTAHGMLLLLLHRIQAPAPFLECLRPPAPDEVTAVGRWGYNPARGVHEREPLHAGLRLEVGVGPDGVYQWRLRAGAAVMMEGGAASIAEAKVAGVLALRSLTPNGIKALRDMGDAGGS